MSNERLFFTGGQSEDLNVQIIAEIGADSINISANNEWCGSTETGFGATVCVDVQRNDVERLYEILGKWLGKVSA